MTVSYYVLVITVITRQTCVQMMTVSYWSSQSSLARLVCEDGRDREARGCMLLGSLYAGIAFANSPCAGVHALAYPLGSHFKVERATIINHGW